VTDVGDASGVGDDQLPVQRRWEFCRRRRWQRQDRAVCVGRAGADAGGMELGLERVREHVFRIRQRGAQRGGTDVESGLRRRDVRGDALRVQLHGQRADIGEERADADLAADGQRSMMGSRILVSAQIALGEVKEHRPVGAGYMSRAMLAKRDVAIHETSADFRELERTHVFLTE